MADNRITKKRLKNHFAYSWWKYALAAVLGAMGVSLIFASTAYRPPADKQLTVYVLNDYVNTDALQADLWARIKESCPEQEELTVLNIDLTDDTNIYAPMQFSTYVAAQQGDLFLMPRSEMLKIASDGAEEAFVDLTEYIEGGVIDVGGLDLSGRHDRRVCDTRGAAVRLADGILQQPEGQRAVYSALFAESGYRREGDSDSDGAGRGRKACRGAGSDGRAGGTAAGIQIKHKFFKRQGGMNDDAALLFAYSRFNVRH